MPRDFKSFANENKQEIQDKKEEYQDIINKYKDMDNNQLMQNLFQQANKLKQEGKLNSSMLNGLENTLAPFLNDEQKNLLNSLVNAINEQK